MPHNFYLGDNELVIVIRNGVNVVLEKYEEYDEVFRGTFGQCFYYCKDRVREYEESIIG